MRNVRELIRLQKHRNMQLDRKPSSDAGLRERMEPDSAVNPVQLAPPGAGLPVFEHLYLRYWLLPVVGRRLGWAGSARLFEREGRRVLDAVGRVSPDRLDEPVLIERLRGLEDSSRRWSVAQTLEHLHFTGSFMRDIIFELSHGRNLSIDVDIAKAKPKGNLRGEEAVAAFRQFMTDVPPRLEVEVGDRASPLRHRHPWFGPITATQWRFVMASHQFLHRQQIDAIVRGLSG